MTKIFGQWLWHVTIDWSSQRSQRCVPRARRAGRTQKSLQMVPASDDNPARAVWMFQVGQNCLPGAVEVVKFQRFGEGVLVKEDEEQRQVLELGSRSPE
ncbi:uncharacterized protein BDW70DRAFT_21783 [Aspergillus foveolatus]|uniref:uncharacterized protein n=1 Tax=Aspergillus foveolatus TaxID=210207 RepID=UPI003CCCA65B